MNTLVTWVIILPLISGFILLFAQLGGKRLQQSLSLLSVLALIFISFDLLQSSMNGVQQVNLIGNWQAPFGIVLVADQLSSLLVFITSLLALGALWYAIANEVDSQAQGSHFHVLFQILLFGVNGAFMTGDLFNLFVFFEVLLIASYGLHLHGGGALRTRAGLQYVVINLVGSTFFLIGVGVLYGVLGTLNIADLALKIAEAPAEDYGVIAAAGLILLVVFGVKVAIFPLYLWLPSAYSQTSAPVAAMFAIMTKVGLYSIIRVHGTLFGELAGDLSYFHIPWVLGLGLLTLIMAALAILAAKSLKQMVAYLVLASVATLLIGVGINNQQAMSATLYYLIHSTLVAGGMFLLADTISRCRGHWLDNFASAPPIQNAIFIGSLFLFAAIAMAGMPPLSGFFGKVLILASASNQAWFYPILAIVLLSSITIIIAMVKAGSVLFYKTQASPEFALDEDHSKPGLVAIVGLLAAAALLVVFANPVTSFTDQAAAEIFQLDAYIEAVLQTQVKPSPFEANLEVNLRAEQ